MPSNLSDKDTSLQANRTAPDRQSWGMFFDRLFLFLGSTLVLAGVIYFFAYNWAKMHRFLKFGLIEAAILAAVLLAWYRGFSTTVGKVLLLSAAVLVGPFLAVYSQVYQTGADPYELFVGWALLITGWVIFGAFGALWLVLLTLVNVGLILYWNQILTIRPGWDAFYLFPVLAAVNIAAYSVWEEGKRREIRWLAAPWYPRIIAGAAITYLTIYSIIAILDKGAGHLIVYLLLGGTALVLGYFRYQDLPVLAACMLSTVFVATTFIVKVLEPDDASVFLIIGLLVAGMTAAAAAWLLSVQRRWDRSSRDQTTGEAPAVPEEKIPASRIPWYIQALIGSGAWLAAIMFLIFFVGIVAAATRASGTLFIVQGLLLCAGQIYVFRTQSHRLFLGQFALALGLAGQLLFAFGIGQRTDEVAVAAIALAILELVLAALCRNKLQIFLSILIASVALTFAVWDLGFHAAINGLVILPGVFLLFLGNHQSLSGKGLYRAAGYGAAASMFAVLLLSFLTRAGLQGMNTPAIHWWISTGALLLILLAFEHMAAQRLGVTSSSPTALLLVGGTILLSILCWRSPGILAVLFVLGLGYQKSDKLLVGLALMFLPVFLTAYYYQMDLTLLQKSAALTGPGAFMLVFRVILKRKTLPAESISGKGGNHA